MVGGWLEQPLKKESDINFIKITRLEQAKVSFLMVELEIHIEFKVTC